jgi:hypothetical protein
VPYFNPYPGSYPAQQFPSAAAAAQPYPSSLSDLNSNMYPGFGGAGAFDHPASPHAWHAQWQHQHTFAPTAAAVAAAAACRSTSMYDGAWHTAIDAGSGSGSSGGGGANTDTVNTSASDHSPSTSDGGLATSDSPGVNVAASAFGQRVESPSQSGPSLAYLSSTSPGFKTEPAGNFGLPPGITVSTQQGSVGVADTPSPMSSPTLGSVSRPQPARSPYEWMKKQTYQSQTEKNGKKRTTLQYEYIRSCLCASGSYLQTQIFHRISIIYYVEY